MPDPMTTTGTQTRTVDRLVVDEARRNERQINTVRAVLMGVIVVMTLMFRWTHGPQVTPNTLFELGIAAMGAVTAAVIHFALREEKPPAWISYFSVTMDDIVIAALLVGHKVFFHPDIAGMLGTLNDRIFLFVFVVNVAAGLRFDARLVKYAALLGSAVTLGLFLWDTLFLGLPLDPFYGAISLIAVATTGFIALLVTRKTRRLIREATTLELERERVKNVFARYVSREVAETLLAADLMPLATGQRRDVTILFCDIRGFTAMTEDMAPEEVVAFLNAYFSVMVDAIFSHGGTIDKYLGDGIMAIFGAPVPQKDHAAQAVAAAMEMRRALDRFNQARAAVGRPPVKIGIGLHAGECVVGTIGAEHRLEFTAVGDVVNVASRIEGLTKEVGADILVSGDVLQRLPVGIAAEPLPQRPIRGKARPVEIYRLAA
jgi:class 3 adenylate cyclase